MNKAFRPIGILSVLLLLLAGELKAQTPNPTPAASPSPGAPKAGETPSPNPSASAPATGTAEEAADEGENGDEEEKPFVPHWTGQLEMTYSNQPNQLAQQGQVQKELSFTGTYNLTESGHYCSMEIAGGQQLVEGANTNYGQVSLEGGLGLGIFYPSLNLQAQEGSSALNSFSGTLTLNFKLLDPLETGLTGGGTLESHQGPNPISQAVTTLVEIDDASWNGGVMVEVTPWDFETISLTGQLEYDLTYQYQNLTHTSKTIFNQPYQIPSLTLGTQTTFWNDFILDLSLQAGQEIYPAGTFYSKAAAKTLTFSQPTTSNFTSLSAGLIYNLE